MTNREERRRRAKPGPAIVSGDCVAPWEEDDEELWFSAYYLQLAQTLGLRRFDHPEIAARITFTLQNGGADVLRQLCHMVVQGRRFAAGDRVEITVGPWRESRTVELRQHTTVYGQCLLAVVLGVEEDFQQLSEEAAQDRIAQSRYPIDPYARY